MRSGAKTARGIHVAVLAVTLAVVASFFGALCTANTHGSSATSHVHAAGFDSGDHCHHGLTEADKAGLDRALPRTSETAGASPLTCHGLLLRSATRTDGPFAASPDTGGISRIGRELLIILNVSRT
ncbi:hypothetical protein SK571_30325 [Lentzea sp. BCCO 10_0798]|uniref:Uncharacterized protein n=1 Tax=Lentzea kristufekii TaxID=3095430 RepID=A0ABU4TZE7_9PSEU|nr:hypothetical protein [Lentzea sp. BCCO 10_0798]MDX8053689.1 hypothetical protein [Lentzea sp. BCCO 10_0798]